MLISFVLIKSLLRPYILQHNFPEFLKIFVLSYPNFCEAIVGVFVLTMILMRLSKRHFSNQYQLKDHQSYVAAILLAAIYVTTQEMELHYLGGNNIYDPYDLAFSIVGLITAYLLLISKKPSLTREYKGRILRF